MENEALALARVIYRARGGLGPTPEEMATEPLVPATVAEPIRRPLAKLCERLGLDPGCESGPSIEVTEQDPIWRTHESREEERTQSGRSTYREVRLQEAARAAVEGRDAPQVPCPGKLRLLADDGEPSRSVECDQCGETMGISRLMLDASLLAAERLARSGLPVALLGVVFERTPETVEARDLLREWVKRWAQDDRPKPPTLWGEPGRGKTHLLTQSAAAVIKHYYAKCVYWSATDLLDALRSSYNAKMGCPEWEDALDAPLLVLDDLGAEQLTDWSQERLATLIDHRYRLALPMLVATNIPPRGWSEHFGARTASRLAGMTAPVEVGGRDWRQGVPSGTANKVAAATTSNDDSMGG